MIVGRNEGRSDRTGALYGMWFFLFTEILFFGGMFLLYSVFRSRYAADFHHAALDENLVLGAVNTAVLLTSSLTMALSIAAVRRDARRLSTRLQAATIALGAVFLIIKYFEWGAKITKGLYPGSATLLALPKGEILFFSLYFVMTGLHALHVIIGLIVIAFMIRFTIRGVIGPDSHARLENTGLYWHFVDIVWIYLFPIFYLVT